MKKILSFLIVNCLSLWVIDAIFSNITIGSWQALVLCAVVIGVLNATVKPLLNILSLPVTIVTFGLFSLIINALILWMTLKLVPGASSTSFGWTIIAALVLSIVNSFLKNLIGDDD